MKTFKLKNKQNPYNHETLGLSMTFFEKKVRNSNETIFCVAVSEDNAEVEVSEEFEFVSWEGLKAEFPTLKSLLVEFSETQKFFASWRENERVSFISSIKGHDGLYETPKATVFYDYKNAED